MTDQIIPFGGSVEVSSDGSTYTEIPECKSMPLPSTTTEYPEVTSLSSPNGFREFIPGLKDGGEISFTAGYTPAGFELVNDLTAAGTLAYVRVTLPLAPSQSTTGDVFEFRAYLTPAPDAGDVGAPVNMEIACRISGDFTWTKGS